MGHALKTMPLPARVRMGGEGDGGSVSYHSFGLTYWNLHHVVPSSLVPPPLYKLRQCPKLIRSLRLL